MRQHRPLVLSVVIALTLFCLAGSSSAQLPSRYTAGLMIGFGSPIGSGPSGSTIGDVYLLDDSFDVGYQLLFNLDIRDGVLFGVRLGQMDVELATPILEQLGAPVASDLTYFTLSGEYRLPIGSYMSGLYIGTGYYSVDGQSIFEDDSALGLTLGTTGDFRINDHWSLMVEFSGHYADLDVAQFFVMAHAGVAFHF